MSATSSENPLVSYDPARIYKDYLNLSTTAEKEFGMPIFLLNGGHNFLRQDSSSTRSRGGMTAVTISRLMDIAKNPLSRDKLVDRIGEQLNSIMPAAVCTNLVRMKDKAQQPLSIEGIHNAFTALREFTNRQLVAAEAINGSLEGKPLSLAIQHLQEELENAGNLVATV